jgi:hypothetical protein
VDQATAKKATIQIVSGWPLYASSTVVAYWFPIAGLTIIAGIQVLWILLSIGDDVLDDEADQAVS